MEISCSTILVPETVSSRTDPPTPETKFAQCHCGELGRESNFSMMAGLRICSKQSDSTTRGLLRPPGRLQWACARACPNLRSDPVRPRLAPAGTPLYAMPGCLIYRDFRNGMIL